MKAYNFEYDPAKLSEEQLLAIENFRKAHDEKIARLREEEDERMQHYYDCVDDYSWGGPCSKANALAQDRTHSIFDVMVEQVVRGGFILRTKQRNVLKNKETGEVVAVGTHEGRYGRFFVTEDGTCVGCAKNVSTYEKKGFLPFLQTITEKMKFDGYWWKSGDPKYQILDTVVDSEVLSTEIVYC